MPHPTKKLKNPEDASNLTQKLQSPQISRPHSKTIYDINLQYPPNKYSITPIFSFFCKNVFQNSSTTCKNSFKINGKSTPPPLFSHCFSVKRFVRSALLVQNIKTSVNGGFQRMNKFRE